ncbi:GPP34 family phosphoprotein [Sphaerisporangium album]|uniref:GPP34 family phosphoprotein n=1 Tax=Sphaerisporangium album TaxID=509200 RepID=A0A367FGD4_9ACTN|nr:GPP34 family phosphoprotein [Sphaerisporangium album]RCG28660.1 GPP34 family phosphoprotein [Sphaerisporangium album]
MAEGDLKSPSLADDLFFVMHDNATGRTRLHLRLASLGLAGAVLGELMLAERLTMDVASGQDRLYVTTRDATGDPVTQNVLDQVAAEPQHPVLTWLLFFARTVYADVATRMIAANLLKPATRNLLKQQRPVPVDPNVAAWPQARLNLAVQRREPPVTRDCVLYGLFVATGGAQRVLWEHDPAFVATTLAMLPAPLQRLIVQTEVAVGQAVISRR